MLIYVLQIGYIAASHTASGIIPTLTSSSSTKKRHQQLNRHQHYYHELSAQIQDANTDQHNQEYEEMNSHHPTLHQQTPASTHSRTSNEQPLVQAHGHGLLTLLSTDLDVYVEQHIEEYETEKVKWATCEIEEWVKHADAKMLLPRQEDSTDTG
jgi:NAD-dependent DNA ligase